MDSQLVLKAWCRACEITVSTMELSATCERGALREALADAGISIAAAIASARCLESQRSRAGRHFLHAKGLCAEMRTHAYIAARLGQLGDRDSEALIRASLELGEVLQAVIDSCAAEDEPARPDPATSAAPE